jgi:hypothetical protein
MRFGLTLLPGPFAASTTDAFILAMQSGVWSPRPRFDREVITCYYFTNSIFFVAEKSLPIFTV